jgi:hypothetical protein
MHLRKTWVRDIIYWPHHQHLSDTCSSRFFLTRLRYSAHSQCPVRAEDLWVLGDEVEQSLPVDLEFAPWHEEELIGEYGSHIDEYHGWTDGSRRVSAAFGWSLRGYNDQGKEVELECNKGSLGEFETAFDGEMEAIADIMEYAIDNQIPGDLTIHSDAQAAISRVGHTGTGPGQDRALRVVQAVQRRLRQGWRTRIEWVPGHSGIV